MNNSIFLDSVNLQEIERFSWMIQGVTTTPTFFRREGINYIDFIKEFRRSFPEKELHIEALGNSRENTEIAIKEIITTNWFNQDKVILKIPVSEENMCIVAEYSKQGIKFNSHLVFNSNQACMSAMANSKYVCPLIGRYADKVSATSGKNLHGGTNGAGRDLISEVKRVVTSINNGRTEVMASSIRSSGDFYDAINANADAITVPTKILVCLFDHPYTSEGIKIFLEDMGLK